MILKDKMLIALLLGLTVPKETLMLLSNSRVRAERVYKILKDEKLIAEKKTTHRLNDKHGDIRYTKTICTITKEGLVYITKRKDPEWLKSYDRQWITRSAIYDKNTGFKKSYIERTENVSECAIIASLVGADTPVMLHLTAALSFIDDEAFKKYMGELHNETISRQEIDDDFLDDEFAFEIEPDNDISENSDETLIDEQRRETPQTRKSVTECVYDAMTKAGIDTGIGAFITKKTELRFCDIRHIKEILEYKAQCISMQDFKRVRMNGLLENTNKIVALYSCQDFKLNWYEWFTRADKVLYDMWRRECPIVPRSMQYQTGKYEAALFVKNEHHLFQLISRDKSYQMGKGYSQFYIIPKTSIGVRHLQWIMQQNCEAYEAQLTQMCVEYPDSPYRKNIKSGNAIFPLYDVKYKCVIGFGLFLDILKINAIRSTMETLNTMSFGIMCYDWQVSYYKAIFPEAQYPKLTLYSIPCPFEK